MTDQLRHSDFNPLEERETSVSCDDPLEETLSIGSLKSEESFGNVEEKSSLEPLYEEPLSKTLNKEIHEISPFKQAVKGFVLNKLSKKVGSSHLLSGITEKIVKKLEEGAGKDQVQSGTVHVSESDLNLTTLRSKESSLEGLSSSVSCELQSFVGNDIPLTDVLNVEDAVECLEDLNSNIGSRPSVTFRPSLRSSSISLPSSPAHRFEKRASSVGGSLGKSGSVNLCSSEVLEDQDSALASSSEKSCDKVESGIEETIVNPESRKNGLGPPEVYPENAYSSQTPWDGLLGNNSSKRDGAFKTLKDICSSLSFSHILLIILVVIQVMSTYSLIVFIFDGLVIGYVIYVSICIFVQKYPTSPTVDLPFLDAQLELASIQVSRESNVKKGNVKVLKGEFIPEMVKNHPTDLVGISIEDSCLKILPPFKKAKDLSPQEDFACFNISGASVTLVPKEIKRRSIWNKKYPICLILSGSAVEKADSNNANAADYLVDHHSKDDSAVKDEKALYLFALTDREKETLYWILFKSCEVEPKSPKSPDQKACDTSLKADFSSVSFASLLESNNEDSFDLNFDDSDDNASIILEGRRPSLLFDAYMTSLFETFERMNKFSGRSKSFEDLSSSKADFSKPCESFVSKDDSFLNTSADEYPVDWLNLAVGRVFYDFLTQECWSDYVKARIQKKLDRIEMPSYIESLVVSDVFLGTTLPQLHSVFHPEFDSNGVWFNLGFNYCGSFQMTLQTKLNILKAKQLSGNEATDAVENKSSGIPSSDSSDDEGNEPKNSNFKKKKFMNTIEKMIAHRHFQAVAKSRFVKKYVGDLSNMPLMLTVELNTLHGILTVNIPPAPTDRIWYGFRKDPVLLLNAYPKVGTRDINLTAVVQMIEKKLVQEFKKALVMPNMDDLLIPIMHSPVYNH